MSKHKGDHEHEERKVSAAATAQTSENFTDPAESIESLSAKLEATQAALAEANDRALRFKAESENTRKRAVVDIENANKYGVEKLARELLNVVDSLDRGLEVSSDDQQQTVHLREGLALTHKLLLDTLSKFNIRQVDPRGEVFDPKQHEALTMQPTTDMEPNRVLSVVQKGFLIHDKVLRPARVIVAKLPE